VRRLPLEHIAFYRGAELSRLPPPSTQLAVLELTPCPPLPVLAAWVVRAGVPALVGHAAGDTRWEAYLLDRRGQVSGFHHWPGARDHAPPLLLHRLADRMVGVVLGSQVAVPECGRALALRGADLVVALLPPAAGPYSPLWIQAQENQWVGLEAGDNPRLVVPCEWSPDLRGVIEADRQGVWWTLRLDWRGRDALAGGDPLLTQLNPAVYLRQPWWDA
jgi:hypothetical protein